MSWNRVRRRMRVGEISSPLGKALVEERYLALRRQVPVIYLLAAVNLFALQAATQGRLTLGLNLPTLLLICAAVRAAQWLGFVDRPPHPVMLSRMRQTCWLAALLCTAVSTWCLYLLETAASASHMAIVLFGALTAVGVAFGLSALPIAACIPLVVLALPLAGVAFTSSNPKFVGAAISIIVVVLLILQLLARQSAQFTAVVKSRWMIGLQQEVAETARQEATVAATTDCLTGLPNRRAFVAALDAERFGVQEHFAVAVVDVDRFKVINDTYGHKYGDELLDLIGRRLLQAAGGTVLVARLGGDEFGLLLRRVETSTSVRTWAEQLLAKVNRPATINGRLFAVSVSCGIGVSRDSTASSPSRVLTDADIALYEAKTQSTGKVALFEAEMEAPRHRRAQIEHALKAPGVHENIHVNFQPIVDLLSGRVVANEALARWHDGELGHVSPSEFVPIAEQLDVIGDISDHLMARAVAEVGHWDESIRLSFNLSAVQLCSADLAERTLAALSSAGLEADRLQVEVTETALLADFDRARRNLEALRGAGVLVVLDDFGAGYASIGYLREFQFDQIKLDGALVTAAVDTADGERLLGAVVGLCRAIGVPPVAEHVESAQHLSLLVKLGCPLGQGFWLQPPVPAEEARHRLTSVPCRRPVPVASARRSAA